ncbi:MAG TPA: branched-chain amino acid ABC transporter permease [Paraburkholderia sp.]|jgi:branched-chain amino acid transport system permease protein
MVSATLLGQVLVNGLSLSAIYVLVALGFTLLFGIMRVVNFSHGAFAMLGGYALFLLYGKWHLPYLLAVPLAALVVAALAMVLEYLVFRWFYQKMMQSMIGLLGLNMALVYSAVLLWDVYERSIPPAITTLLSVGGVLLPADRLTVVAIALVALGAFWVFMTRTRFGLAMRAASQDVETAEAQGMDTTALYRMAFFIAIFLTALAGGLYAQTYSLSPFMGDRPLIVAFVVVILGGMGSIPGAALGGVLLGFSESFLSTFYGSAVSSFASFGIVILLLIFRPWGLLGTKEAMRA